MSVRIDILHEQDADGKEYGEPAFDTGRTITTTRNVVGHVLVTVVKKEDGGLDVERVAGVNADSAEDNQIVTDFIKQVEAKVAELFPEDEQPKPMIWVPE
jgi:hypothetical protein